jgi:cardiolipin synthase
MLLTAKSDIIIVCSYFLPGRTLRKHLRAAAARGVKITLVSAGISDVRIAKMAERWLYSWLLRRSIKLVEYQPSVLHAKLATCDEQWFTLGSYNINDISAYASVELNVDVRDPVLCRQMNSLLEEIIKRDCIEITEGSLNSHVNIFRQFARFIAYKIIRIAFHSFTFYFRQHA